MNIFKTVVFYLMLLAITIVAGIDTYFTIRTSPVILLGEKNPIAKFIIEQCDGEVDVFIGLKLICTVLVISLMQAAFIQFKRKKYVLAVTFGVMMFQLWLLDYIYRVS